MQEGERADEWGARVLRAHSRVTLRLPQPGRGGTYMDARWWRERGWG